MKLVKLTGGLIAASTVLSFCVAANAQSNGQSNIQSESFSQCVINLHEVSHNWASASADCLQVFKGKPMNENFSTCVTQLNEVLFNSTTASNYCRQASASSVAQPQPQPQPQQPTYAAPSPSGNPQAISACVNAILYQRQPVCTRSHCAAIGTPEENANDGFGGWQWQTVRSDTSEYSAAQACQNAR